eukprot:153450_1
MSDESDDSLGGLESLERARKEIRKLLQNLNKEHLRSLKKSHHKGHLRSFAYYYRSNHPPLATDVVLLLFEGNGFDYPKGLLQFCGSSRRSGGPKKGELKGSAGLCLQLVSLLVSDKNDDHMVFRDALKRTKMKTIQDMKLGSHVSQEIVPAEHALEVIYVVNLLFSEFDVSEYVVEKESQDLFTEYRKVVVEETEQHEEDFLPHKPAPDRWEEVTEKDFIIDVEDMLESVGESPESEDSSLLGEIGKDESQIDPLGIHTNTKARALAQSAQRHARQMKLWQSKAQPRQRRITRGDQTFLRSQAIIEKSVDPTDQNFDAHLFLTTIHKQSSYAELEQGLRHLQNTVSDQTEKMRLLVRDHFDQFITCKDTIDVVHRVLKDVNPNTKQSVFDPNHLQEEVDEIQKMAGSLYGNVLERKNKADRIRSSLIVLKRFQFLFRMPGRIKRNIATKQYTKVVRDYNRVKLFVVKDDRALLHQVIQETHQIIRSFRQQLLKKLEDPWKPYEEQEKIIGFLVDLDCEEDPTQYYLNRQFEWTLKQLDLCHEEHETRMISVKLRHGVEFDGKIGGGNQSKSPPTAEAASSMSSLFDHSKKKLIAQLSAVLIENIPDFWRLSQEISSGKFAKLINVSRQKNREALVVSIGELIRKIQQKYSDIVHLALIPTDSEVQRLLRSVYAGKTDADSEGKDKRKSKEDVGQIPLFMQDNVKCILQCYRVLRDMKMTKGCLSILRQTADRITHYFVVQVWLKCLLRLGPLHMRERWAMHREVSGVTNLPFMFKDLVEKAIRTLAEVPVGVIKGDWILELIGSPFLECLRTFADSMHELAFNPYIRSKAAKDIGMEDRFMLLVLSNTIYAKDVVFEALFAECSKLIPSVFLSTVTSEFEQVLKLMDSLDQMVFDHYLRQKVIRINLIVKESLMMDGINWEDAPEPLGVRSHCLDFLLQLVYIHQEVYSTASGEVKVVLEKILEKTLDKYLDYVMQIGRFSPNGALQIMIEIDFIKETMENFLSKRCAETIDDIQTLLLNWMGGREGGSSTDKRKVILEKTRKSNEMMFKCFASR